MTTAASTPAPTITAMTPDRDAITVVTDRRELTALRARWSRVMQVCNAAAPEPFIDLFSATLEVTGEDVEPYVLLLDSDVQGHGMIVGRLVTRRIACKIGYWKFHTPQLRCLEITDGGLLTDKTPAARDAILQHLSEMLSSGEVEHLLIGHLPVEHELFDALAKRSTGGPRGMQWRLNLVPGSYEETIKSHSKKHRYTLRRSDRLLVEHFGDKVTLDQFTRPDQVEEFIRGAAQIGAQSYQGALGIGVLDNAWWRAILGVEAKHGRLRAYWLNCDGRPIAYHIGAIWAGEYKFQATCFLPEFRELSPGIVLHMRVIKSLCEEGATNIDYGFGDADYKRTYGSESREEQTLHLYGRNARAIWSAMLDRSCGLITRGAKRVVASLGIMQWLKRTWRSRLQKTAE